METKNNKEQKEATTPRTTSEQPKKSSEKTEYESKYWDHVEKLPDPASQLPVLHKPTIREVFSSDVVLASKYVNCLTKHSARQSDSLIKIRHEIGEPETEIIVGKVFNEISKYTNTKMDAVGKMEFAKMILRSVPELKIDELLLISRDIILGNYGIIYGNFSFTMFANAVNQFLTAKMRTLELENEQHTYLEKVPRRMTKAERNIMADPEKTHISEHLKKVNQFWKQVDKQKDDTKKKK